MMKGKLRLGVQKQWEKQTNDETDDTWLHLEWKTSKKKLDETHRKTRVDGRSVLL